MTQLWVWLSTCIVTRMFTLLERLGEYVWGPKVEEQDSDDVRGEKEHREISGHVTSIDGAGGTVDHSVYFDLDSVIGGVRPTVILGYAL